MSMLMASAGQRTNRTRRASGAASWATLKFGDRGRGYMGQNILRLPSAIVFLLESVSCVPQSICGSVCVCSVCWGHDRFGHCSDLTIDCIVAIVSRVMHASVCVCVCLCWRVFWGKIALRALLSPPLVSPRSVRAQFAPRVVSPRW